MIESAPFYNVFCDCCKDERNPASEMWWNNKSDAINDALDNANYKELGGKFYCPKCYSYAVINEQDVIVTKDGRRFWDETEEEITITLTEEEKHLVSLAASDIETGRHLLNERANEQLEMIAFIQNAIKKEIYDLTDRENLILEEYKCCIDYDYAKQQGRA